MRSDKRPDADAIWVRPHLNRKGNLVKGHWRSRPRQVSVRGHFRGLSYVKPFKRRRPVYEPPAEFIVAGQPASWEHTLINLLRDVEPLMGYCI